MLHNLNRQQRPEHRIDLYCKRIVPSNQAIVGYDTLGWDQSRGRVSELVGMSIPYTFPAIRTAWSYTTTPVTNYQIDRLRESNLASWSRSVLEVTRVYSTGHTSLATSGKLALQEAQKVNFSDDFSATEPIVRTSAPDLSHFLNRWRQGKSVDMGYVKSDASIDTGPGVTANSEGLGEIRSEEWLLTDTWEDAFPFPQSSREQPPLTLPTSINSIVPRGLPPINRTVFRSLLNF